MKYNYLFSIIYCFLSFLPSGWSHNGSINGQILDTDTRLEVPGALILLAPGSAVTSSNALGFFVFDNLPSGDYSLTVRALGYAEKIITGIQVRDGVGTMLKIDLQATPLQLQDLEVQSNFSPVLQGISAFDIQTRPINNAQDILRLVPGLFIAQHAGGGKAEQIFLRGFDIDHGTDLALSVDGVPVNMVSHAHGQGYADLHFLIPEVIDNVAFNKGPYQPGDGDFATAGSIQFKTVNALDRNFVKVEAGQFHTGRAVGAFDLLGPTANRKNRHAYLATEANYSDGYFDAPQGFRRFNAIGKFSTLLDDQQSVSISLSAFQSNWDASGQIPERVVRSGAIGRFGAIDPTEGGQTSRYQVNLEHIKSFSNSATFKNRLYCTSYSFDLYSNFTFFLNDSLNGDQIRQKERRRLLGYEGVYSKQTQRANIRTATETGFFFRSDAIDDVELSRTRNRSELTQRLALGDVDQTSVGAYFSETWLFRERFSVQTALRYDYFLFSYENALDSLYHRQTSRAGVVSPKLNLKAALSKHADIYLSVGYGYHSNDARVSATAPDQHTLPQALGMDLGAILKPTRSLWFNIAGWYLALENELVYVGDEAIVESSGRTRRLGLDCSARMEVLGAFYADLDLTYSHARALDRPEGENRIPLAPRFTGAGGIGWQPVKGFFGRLRFRYLGDRAANEDNSLIARGYFLLDGALGWKSSDWTLELTAQNLTNAEWEEAQFETTSRLRQETAPVTEIHFTPGTPFFLKAGFSYFF